MKERAFGLFEGLEMTEAYTQQLAEKDAKIEKAIDEALQKIQKERVEDAYRLRNVDGPEEMVLPLAQQEQKMLRTLWRPQYEQKSEFQTEIEKAFLSELASKDPEAARAREAEATRLQDENTKQADAILNDTLYDRLPYEWKKKEANERLRETKDLEAESISLNKKVDIIRKDINAETDKLCKRIVKDKESFKDTEEELKEKKDAQLEAAKSKRVAALAEAKNHPEVIAAKNRRKARPTGAQQIDDLCKEAIGKWSSMQSRPEIVIETGVANSKHVKSKVDCVKWMGKSIEEREEIAKSFEHTYHVTKFMSDLHEQLKAQGVDQVDWEGNGIRAWKNENTGYDVGLMHLLNDKDVMKTNSFKTNMENVFEENVVLTYKNAESRNPSRIRLNASGQITLEEYPVPKEPKPLTGFTKMWSNFCKKLHITSRAQKDYDRERAAFEAGGKMASFYSSEKSRPRPHSAKTIEKDKNDAFEWMETQKKALEAVPEEEISRKLLDWYLPYYKEKHPEAASIKSLYDMIYDPMAAPFKEETEIEGKVKAEVEKNYKEEIEDINNDYKNKLSGAKSRLNYGEKALQDQISANETAIEKTKEKYVKEWGEKAQRVADSRERRMKNMLQKNAKAKENETGVKESKADAKENTVEAKEKAEKQHEKKGASMGM